MIKDDHCRLNVNIGLFQYLRVYLTLHKLILSYFFYFLMIRESM